MAKESEFTLVMKGLIIFMAFCVPYFVMGFPLIMWVTTGEWWWVLLVPVSIILGFLTKGAVKIAIEGLQD